jgi:hypothetical protein
MKTRKCCDHIYYDCTGEGIALLVIKYKKWFNDFYTFVTPRQPLDKRA